VVVDTGIASVADRNRSDGWLDDVSGDTDPLDIMPPLDYLDLGAGHGTYVAGIIQQVEPATKVHVLRALKWDGFAPDTLVTDKIQEAAEYIAAHGGRGVINLSLGGATLFDMPPHGLKMAIDAASSDGVAIVASAGNSADSVKHWPAAFDSVIAVAGLKRDGSPAEWSTRGDWVDFSAVAEGLISTYVLGEEAQGTGELTDPHDQDPDQWTGANPNAVWLGTSFAAPQVAAWIARYLAENPEKTVEDAKQALEELGDPEPGFGHRVDIN
jgi:hypothetical protein